MKHFIPIIAIVSLCCSVVFGKAEKFDKNLEKPDAVKFSSTMGEKSLHLKKLLDQGELKKFYEAVNPLFDYLNKTDRKAMTREEVSDVIWCFYLVCGAPLFEVDITTDDPWPYGLGRDDEDILIKNGVLSFIPGFDIDHHSKTTGVTPSSWKNLNIAYFSSALKTFRSAYKPGLGEKITELEGEIHERYKNEEDEEPIRNRQYKIQILGGRNILLEHFIKYLEKDFVNMLVKYYPGKLAEVKRSFKLAGYTDEEIPGLIDRTVGRDEKTEFLYKGRKEQKADKKR